MLKRVEIPVCTACKRMLVAVASQPMGELRYIIWICANQACTFHNLETKPNWMSVQAVAKGG